MKRENWSSFWTFAGYECQLTFNQHDTHGWILQTVIHSQSVHRDKMILTPIMCHLSCRVAAFQTSILPSISTGRATKDSTIQVPNKDYLCNLAPQPHQSSQMAGTTYSPTAPWLQSLLLPSHVTLSFRPACHWSMPLRLSNMRVPGLSCVTFDMWYCPASPSITSHGSFSQREKHVLNFFIWQTYVDLCCQGTRYHPILTALWVDEWIVALISRAVWLHPLSTSFFQMLPQRVRRSPFEQSFYRHGATDIILECFAVHWQPGLSFWSTLFLQPLQSPKASFLMA